MTRAGADRIGGLFVLADDAPAWKHDPVAQAEAACAGGAAVIQLRAKSATDREALAWARAIREVTAACGALFFVNDRFDLALATGADGVHLGQDDLPPDRLPLDARAQLLVGRSTHSPEQIARARVEPVDYVAFGPVFETRSKTSEWSARTPQRLAEAVAAAAPRPVVAIGGIDATNIGAVGRAGAAGAAVISAVASADDPLAETRDLVALFAGARAGTS